MAMHPYWRLARAPRYSILFAAPLLVLYEALAFALSHDAYAGLRNGADVLLKSLFVALGGRRGLIVFGALLVGVGTALVWRDLRRNGRVKPRIFPLMLVEATLAAVVVGGVTSAITGLLLRPVAAPAPAPLLALAPIDGLGWPTQLMISLGAGLYEELLFRVLLVAGLALLARGAFKWKPVPAGVFATVLGALIFSAFHYIGPYGDPWALGSFTFRAVAGLLFSALYLLRGFGITAWAHALYDIMVVW